jgi:hypothetical protein
LLQPDLIKKNFIMLRYSKSLHLDVLHRIKLLFLSP